MEDWLNRMVRIPKELIARYCEDSVPLSKWQPHEMRTVVFKIRAAKDLRVRGAHYMTREPPFFTIFCIDSAVELPILDAFCDLFAGDFAGSFKLPKEGFLWFQKLL